VPSNVDNHETQNKDKQKQNKKYNTKKMSNTEPTIKQIIVSNSCSISHVILVKKPVISYAKGTNDEIETTTSGTCPWAYVMGEIDFRDLYI
jgi:hypothetical protein